VGRFKNAFNENNKYFEIIIYMLMLQIHERIANSNQLGLLQFTSTSILVVYKNKIKLTFWPTKIRLFATPAVFTTRA
jgi:hypothetical protein